jgi:hypothetical protein
MGDEEPADGGDGARRAAEIIARDDPVAEDQKSDLLQEPSA